MKIAKEFNWEMGHRLPEHFGKCKNIHGHSYKMLVEIEGDVLENGMVMDYYHLKDAIEPLVEKWIMHFSSTKMIRLCLNFLRR